MSDLRAFLLEHPALVWWLGFARVRDQSAPYGFDVAQTVPKRRHFSTVLRMTFFCPFCQPYDLANPPVREEAAQTLYTATVHTLEEARGFVLRVGLCGVLHDPKGKLPTLWDALDFAGRGPDQWGEKLARIWALRQQLAATYPEQIFTGKIRGERIVPISMERLIGAGRADLVRIRDQRMHPIDRDKLLRDGI
jgi:hypothetical protein